MPQFRTESEITWPYAFKTFGYTMLIDTVIALFLTFIGFREGQFWEIFIFSQCIGLSICSSILAITRFLTISNPLMQTMAYLGGLLIGSMGGTLLGSLLAGIRPLSFFQESKIFGQTLMMGLIFGSVIAYFFISRERLAEARVQLQEERIKRITGEKAVVEADLKRLQAQVEPHFLFNTLSNVLSLIDTDPATGKAMLNNLTGYLRTSLDRTRCEISTIGQEMAMIRDYMEIHKIRMGDRFNFTIDVPEEVSNLPFPPMLIQPLVENALRHGLEPKIEGGEINVRVIKSEETIRVEITDTGVGMQVNAGNGVGLSSVKERLTALYGTSSKLTFEENRPSGLNAVIEVPHATG